MIRSSLISVPNLECLRATSGLFQILSKRSARRKWLKTNEKVGKFDSSELSVQHRIGESVPKKFFADFDNSDREKKDSTKLKSETLP